ncbi:MAG: hypothetical protein O2960_19415 [Verrucomicrobia bacterium]|nr:hypothetical protein [Verrucomicrobiota bacterium]
MNPSQKPKKRRWGKRSLWTFIIVNVLGIVLILPILPTILPLVRIWWDTRSQESFERQSQSDQKSSVTDFTEGGGSETPLPNNPAPQTEPTFNALTNSLEVVKNLDDSEIAKIIALQYGEKSKAATNSTTFDRDSAVFHSIKKTMANLNGRQYHCYEVDLVDQSGNHKIHVDCFEEPDLDYERSMATLELVNQNPQLKKIYDAFSQFLGEQSSNPTNAAGTAPSENDPSFRFERPDN